jgi:hypothetical protein
LDTHLSDTFTPKNPKLWRLYFQDTEFMSLGELLKIVWGQPASKIVDGERVVLLASGDTKN